MRAVTTLVLLFGFACVAGCGGSPTTLNTTPLSEEQKAKIKEEDQLIESEESPKNKTYKAKGKGK